MIYIMMATYNGKQYIREQIESILNQTYKDWKLWISDDGSTDGTLSILQEYLGLYPKKMELLITSRKKQGAKDNFAFLFTQVPNAEYYAFCDQDDIWEKDKLYTLISRFSRQDQKTPSLIYHDLEVVDYDKKVISPSFFKYSGLKMDQNMELQQVLMYNWVPGCTMMYNHSLRLEVSKIPEACVMHDWWLLISALYLNAKVMQVDKSLGQYRQHGNNNIGAIKKKTLGQTLLQCFDLINIKKYKNNNAKIKKERIQHAELLLKLYNNKLSESNRFIINDYLSILLGKNKLKNFKEAKKKGFVFYNIIYTMKFYLL